MYQDLARLRTEFSGIVLQVALGQPQLSGAERDCGKDCLFQIAVGASVSARLGGDLGTENQKMKHGTHLLGLPRCPFCGVAKPMLHRIWRSEAPLKASDGSEGRLWAGYCCTACSQVVTARGKLGQYKADAEIDAIYPDLPIVDAALPESAQKFLQQAYETLHAPDAATVMAPSAVDAMLKAREYSEGSLYRRIEKAVEDHVLTADMGEWAHHVRLESNRPRHADEKRPHVDAEEAKQTVQFAKALGEFLFVLPARVARGIAAATGQGGESGIPHP